MEITPQELKKELDTKKKILIVDVRQPEEFDFVHLEGSKNIPLPEFQSRVSEIPKDAGIVTVCHHGNRSMQAAVILNSLGYKARSLKGGQYEWAKQIDKKMKYYNAETYYENGKIKCEVWEVKD
ncbi:MAG: rhodanese-like domain-containing protein [DPANN group archaeon]|nr:rhodanese-like domain-containing protein [DPANN group archaeon]